MVSNFIKFVIKQKEAQSKHQFMSYQQTNQQSCALFQNIDVELQRHLQNIKPDASCVFSLDQVFDIDDLCNPDLLLKNDPVFQLQIRQDYILQIVQKQTVKGNKSINVDTIVSGIRLNDRIKFQIKRQYQPETQPIPNPIGIIFYLNQNQQPLELISQDAIKNIQAFGKLLESKFLVQKGFHKIFKPLRKIGKGSSATVIEGKDLRNKKNYAIKGFKKSQGYSFQKGIALKQLEFYKQNKNPYIIKLNSVFESQNSIYMVLDKYDQNLYDFLTNKGLNSQYELKAIMKGILQAIQFLHNKGIMHRDIKPQNIMVGKRQFDKKELLKRKTDIVPVLIDFGFSQNQNNAEFTVYRCGTPGFIAPQILADCLVGQQISESFNSQKSTSKKKYGKACDIFSLGCLFHLLLTNRMPFWGSTKNELLKKNIEANLDSTSRQYKLLDKSAKNLLFRMLEKDPLKRITASQALKDDFFRLQMFNFKKIHFKNPFNFLNQRQKVPQKEEVQKQINLFQ